MNKPELVVLAAGMGSRYGGLKQIDEVDNEGHIIIDYSIFDAIEAGFKTVTFIIKHEIEAEFRAVIDPHLAGKDIEVKYVFQELDKLPEGYSVPDGRRKPWGTGHAIACCEGVVKGPFAVINADDYYGKHAFVEMFEFLSAIGEGDTSSYCMVGYEVGKTVTEIGTVSRGVCEVNGEGYLTGITERTKVGIDNGDIYFEEEAERFPLDPKTTVSMNLWGLPNSYITECRDRFKAFLDEGLKKNPEKCEFYMPSVISELLGEGKIGVKVLKNRDKWYGVTYKEDKPEVVRAFRELIESGVYPEKF